ncbi:hypothetical protein CES85_3486 (plasmid) [Ochrobactrum quorumnocens]|uniref:Uncharacterized protein n=1 Tax=Ochrobactrum quorumnocens TaxID=271865 RepID=A0A248UP85_9HYPH|nr:hypothetical protein CES85_3486 [[Ochrobactrum] quorumnocens]
MSPGAQTTNSGLDATAAERNAGTRSTRLEWHFCRNVGRI